MPVSTEKKLKTAKAEVVLLKQVNARPRHRNRNEMALARFIGDGDALFA